MRIHTDSVISITEANQDFSRVTRMVDEKGFVVIHKNNSPRYLVIEFNRVEQEQIMADEDVMSISRRIMEKNREAYEVLAR